MNLQKISLPWFDIRATMESGQCFRWSAISQDRYRGWIRQYPVELVQRENCVEAVATSEMPSDQLRAYFDAGRDYETILDAWKKSDDLSHIVERWKGIRILRQPLQETILSFILSANNNIPRIQGMIERFCRQYGEPGTMLDGQPGFAFPNDWSKITVSESELRELGFGYRAKYVAAAIEAFQSGAYSEAAFSRLSREEQGERLLSLMGVGPKVAACIQLFALGDFGAFPMDVWVLRIMRERYLSEAAKPKEIETFAKSYFGEARGYIQQLLFHEYRMRERKHEGSERG